jgi:hypothetical protein
MAGYRDLIHSFINGSTALCWTLASFLIFVIFFYTDGRMDELPARRKAVIYTEDNTNTE